MYVPRDPPLVLHLPTSWQLVCSRSYIYNLTTENYENLAADTKATLLCYIKGEGDSDQYDSEEEAETIKILTEEEKKLYDEY